MSVISKRLCNECNSISAKYCNFNILRHKWKVGLPKEFYSVCWLGVLMYFDLIKGYLNQNFSEENSVLPENIHALGKFFEPFLIIYNSNNLTLRSV